MFLWNLASILYVVTSTGFLTGLWYSLYKTLKSRYRLEGEYTARIIAAFHGAVCVVLATICMAQGSDPLNKPGESNTPLETLTLQISVGYFVYDFVWCVKYQPEPKIMLLHHLASIFAMCYITILGRSGPEAIGGLCSMEVTNPLLQARWFLKHHNQKNTYLYWIVEYLFFGMFISVRLVYGSFLLHSVLTSELSNIVVKLSTISLYLISLAFMYNIVSIVLYRVRRKPQRTRLSALLEPESSKDVKRRSLE